MFIKEHIDEKQYIIKSIWKEICEEVGFNFNKEFFYPKSNKYILYKNEIKDEEVIGFIDISPYNIDYIKNNLHMYYNFSRQKIIKDNMDKVYLLDKVALIPEERGKGLFKYIHNGLLHHSKTYNTNLYVSIIRPHLYKKFTQCEDITITQVGKVLEYAKFTLYPVIIKVNN